MSVIPSVVNYLYSLRKRRKSVTVEMKVWGNCGKGKERRHGSNDFAWAFAYLESISWSKQKKNGFPYFDTISVTSCITEIKWVKWNKIFSSLIFIISQKS